MLTVEVGLFCFWGGGEAANLLRLPRAAAHLRDQQVDTEWCILVFQKALQLGDLLAQHVGRVADAADNAQAASVGDSSGEFGAGGDVHAGEHDGVVDLEEVCDRRAELFWKESQLSMVRLAGEQREEREGFVRGDAMVERRLRMKGSGFRVVVAAFLCCVGRW